MINQIFFLSLGTFFYILSFFVFDRMSYFFCIVFAILLFFGFCLLLVDYFLYVVFDNLLLILCYLYNILLTVLI